jgi:hypothetical protein
MGFEGSENTEEYNFGRAFSAALRLCVKRSLGKLRFAYS